MLQYWTIFAVIKSQKNDIDHQVYVCVGVASTLLIIRCICCAHFIHCYIRVYISMYIYTYTYIHICALTVCLQCSVVSPKSEVIYVKLIEPTFNILMIMCHLKREKRLRMRLGWNIVCTCVCICKDFFRH